MFGLINFYFLSHHILSKLWNFTLNTQVIVPGIHRVLRVSSYGWRSNISFSVHMHAMYIYLPNTHHRYKDKHRYIPWYFVRLHTSQVYKHQHCVPRRAFDKKPCHTLGGLDTYHSLSVNVSSDYSIHQMLLHIQASYYYRSLRAEISLCLIELPWSQFPSLHTSKAMKVPSV